MHWLFNIYLKENPFFLRSKEFLETLLLNVDTYITSPFHHIGASLNQSYDKCGRSIVE